MAADFFSPGLIVVSPRTMSRLASFVVFAVCVVGKASAVMLLVSFLRLLPQFPMILAETSFPRILVFFLNHNQRRRPRGKSTRVVGLEAASGRDINHPPHTIPRDPFTLFAPGLIKPLPPTLLQYPETSRSFDVSRATDGIIHTDHAPSTSSPEGDHCVSVPQTVQTPCNPVRPGESWTCVCCRSDASNEGKGYLS